jgi:hypothetical protein
MPWPEKSLLGSVGVIFAIPQAHSTRRTGVTLVGTKLQMGSCGGGLRHSKALYKAKDGKREQPDKGSDREAGTNGPCVYERQEQQTSQSRCRISCRCSAVNNESNKRTNDGVLSVTGPFCHRKFDTAHYTTDLSHGIMYINYILASIRHESLRRLSSGRCTVETLIDAGGPCRRYNRYEALYSTHSTQNI